MHEKKDTHMEFQGWWPTYKMRLLVACYLKASRLCDQKVIVPLSCMMGK